MEGLETRDLMAVAIFQEGLNGYSGQEDTVLYNRTPDVNAGTEGSISPDQQDASGVRQGLMQFANIFGDLPGQIPVGSTINSATLVLDVINDSNSAMQMSFYRMLTPWGESTATWNTFGVIGGVQASEGEASDLPPDGIIFDSDTSANSPTAGIIDVTKSLEYWASGAENNGWMIESAATNGWDFRTKESAQSLRPRLEVNFTAPNAGSGSAKLLTTVVRATEGASGASTAYIDVARVGGTTGSLSVDYAIAAGTAGANDFTATTGSITFADGEAFARVPVEIFGDTSLEGNQTVTVTLSGAPIVGDSVATLTIADDDALINEVLANVSNSNDETNREFIELIGTPGASLAGYYFVVFEGEEEAAGGTAGAGMGVADFVIDLSGHSFGSNGLLVITPTDWAYTAAAGTTVVTTSKLDGQGGKLEDSSQTYALIRSLGAPIVEGTDYDVAGAYENGTNQAIGIGVGILDALPAGAQLVDSVGVVEGGGNDRDRALTTQELDHPGIHVHQPTGLASSEGTTSDAVSRRIGQTLPNSIGAWFNGDIASGALVNGVVPYLNDSFVISVVAPDGSVLTPGAPNILRSVFFSLDDQDAEVAEAAGSVTLTIERTGDIANEAVNVTYRTVGGTADQDIDYVGVEQTVTLLAGEATKDITIDLIGDMTAEGFERFSVEIIAVDNAYTIGDGRATTENAVNGVADVTIADANVQIATFQNGVNGYAGTQDTYLDGELQFNRFGGSSIVRVDQEKGEGEGAITSVRPQQAMLRFDDLFGGALGQVPAGATIFDAFITVNVVNVAPGAEVNLFPMLQDWEEVNASWFDPQGNRGSSILNGVTPDNLEASVRPDGTVANPGRAGLVEIPLDVDSLQAWANGSRENLGWSIISDASSLWAFNSSEAFLAGTVRPELTILYTDPVETDPGVFSLSIDQSSVNEFAGFAEITINRIGGSEGAANVSWSLTAGTADLSDIAGATSGSVSFADGELFKTFQIEINDDLSLETNETLTVSISGVGLTFDRDEQTLTIRDNDFNALSSSLLLNEIWINSPGNDPPHEFVELVGTAGLNLGSLYYLAIEGSDGSRVGVAEKVIDIGKFSNGSTGYTLLTPDASGFAFNVPTGTTQIDLLGPTSTENVASQNDSTTYVLLYSPLTELTTTAFDYDWDDDGALELPAGVTIVDSLGVLVAGGDDQMYGPATNRVEFNLTDTDVDAVTRLRGKTTKNSGASWFGGDLFAAGDDYLLYDAIPGFPVEAFNLPVVGAALTPGEVNVGTAVQSPLVSLIGAVGNADGTITLTFDGAVSQALIGDGGTTGPSGASVTISDASGNAIPGVDVVPIITGLGSTELTLSFAGSAVVGGALPTGSYQLNVVGNAIIGNGRAIDAAGTGAPAGSNAFAAVMVSGLTGDYNGDGFVNSADYTIYRDTLGSTTDLRADGDNNGTIEAADYALWAANYGASGGLLTVGDFEAPAMPALELTMAETLAVEESIPAGFGFLSMPLEAIDTAFALVGDETPAATDDRSDELLLLSASTTAEASDSEDTVAPEREKRGARARGGDTGLGRVFRPAFRG